MRSICYLRNEFRTREEPVDRSGNRYVIAPSLLRRIGVVRRHDDGGVGLLRKMQGQVCAGAAWRLRYACRQRERYRIMDAVRH